MLVGGRTDVQPPTVTGTTTTIADTILGGTFTYSSSGVVNWSPHVADVVYTDFNQVNAPSVFVSVDQPAVVVHAGYTIVENATFNAMNGFSGQAYTSPSGPAGITQSGTWPEPVIAPGSPVTAPLAIQIASDVAPGTYEFDVLTYANSNVPVVTPIEITVAGPQTDIANVLAAVNAQLAGAGGATAAHLRGAASRLGAALDPSLWLNASALDPGTGAAVFVDLAQAAQALSLVPGDSALVADLVAIARELALPPVTASGSTVAAAFFARGDAAAGAGASSVAILAYGVAWRAAERALGG